MKKKWIPVSEEEIIETDKYKYIMGCYNHEEYGNNCFRVSKYIKENNYFIGHFVIVPEDMPILKDIFIRMIKGLKND